MRSPFTSIVFAFELTHDGNIFLPLLVGSVIAHAFTVLTLKRSILTATLGELQQSLRADHRQSQRLLPVVNAEGQFVGVLTRDDIRNRIAAEGEVSLRLPLAEFVRPETVAAYPDEPLRVVVYRMAEKGFTRMPVVEPGTGEFLGLFFGSSVNSLENEGGGLGRRCDCQPGT